MFRATVYETFRLAEIHLQALPIFSQWSPAKEIGKTRMLLDDLELRHSEAAAAIRPVFDQLAARLVHTARRHSQLIHNDFSAKNVLYNPTGFNAPVSEHLAVIDWDSAILGPPEKDIAAFLSWSLRRRQGLHAFLEAYQRKTGWTIDVELVNTLMQYQRLLKLCRRLLRGGDAGVASIGAARDIAVRLQHNPLVE